MVINLTDVALNAANIVNSLNFATNCSIAMDWFQINNPSQYWKVIDPLPTATAGSPMPTYAFVPYDNNTLNLEFLQTALPSQYTNNTTFLYMLQAEMSTLWINGANLCETVNTGNTMYNWSFVNITWYNHALWEIYSNCIGPELFSVHLSDLNTTSNCSAHRQLDSSVTGYHYPQYSQEEVQFWKTFLVPLHTKLNLTTLRSGTIPVDYFNFVDGAVVRWYENIFLQSDSANVTQFARSVFDTCRMNVCHAAGFSGNPDLDGIGVYAAYLFETGLVSILWIYFEFSCVLGWVKVPDRLSNAFHQASGNLLDGAMYFLLSLSLANLCLVLSPDITQYSFYASGIIVVRERVVIIGLCSPFIIAFLVLTIVLAVTLDSSQDMFEQDFGYFADQVCLHNQLNALQNSPPGGFYKNILVITYSLLGAFTILVLMLNRNRILDVDAHKLTTREKVYLTVLSSVPVALAWFHVVLLQNLREAMCIMTENHWSSSSWSYGQVVALIMWIPAMMAFSARFYLGEKKQDKKGGTRLHINTRTAGTQSNSPQSASTERNSAITTDDEEAQKSPGWVIEPLYHWDKRSYRVLAVNF
ncbi:hypothetical protein N431DRAFT_492124 [Stipitochalara longipes BDJ]|nr:hypothetical protein N431DRAFT_492124 [Stipitochalara longipes BDJ]